jgi:hypothetical protein
MEQREGTLAGRILMARMELAADIGDRVPQEMLGAMVGHYLRRDRPITGATVSRWEAGETVPDLETVKALAVVCGVDPGWLGFGSASKAPSPRDHISDPELNEWHAVNVGVLLEREAHERIERLGRRQSRDWSARFNALMREQRSIRRIKDEGERAARETAWQASFDALSEELDQRVAERTALYRDAGEIPQRELTRERERRRVAGEQPNEKRDRAPNGDREA